MTKSTSPASLSSFRADIVARTQNPLSSQAEPSQMLERWNQPLKSPFNWVALNWVEIFLQSALRAKSTTVLRMTCWYHY